MSEENFVSGATGTIGSAIARVLADRGNAVEAAVHVSARPAWISAEGIRYRSFAWDNRADWQSPLSADVLVLIAPAGDARSHILMAPFIDAIDAARTTGVIVISARGIEKQDGVSLREIEKRVERRGIPHLLLRPTWIMQNFVGFLSAGLDAGGVVAVPTGNAAVAFVDSRDLGDAAGHWVAGGCQRSAALTLTGPSALTYDEAVRLVGAAAGREFRHVDVSQEAFRDAMVAHGVPPERVDFMLPMWAAAKAGYEAAVSGDFTRFTGKQSRSFADFAREAGPRFAQPRAH